MLIWWFFILTSNLIYTSAVGCDDNHNKFHFEYDFNFIDRFDLSLGGYLNTTSDAHEGRLFYNVSLTNLVDNSSFIILYYCTYDQHFSLETIRGKAYPCRIPPCTKQIDFNQTLNSNTLINFTIISEGPTVGHLTLEVIYHNTSINDNPSLFQIINGLVEGYWISWFLAIFIL